MPRPIHFEIPANDPDKVIEFYSRALGWKFTKWEGPVEYWVINTGVSSEPGIDGGLMRRRHPDQPCVNTVAVENLERTIDSVITNGGVLAVPKMPVPGVGWLAYCKDTEGHIFGMMQADSTAK
jgi:predicted enzyme related to lactoylglutathione lyase